MGFVLALLEILCNIFAFLTVCFITIAKIAGKIVTGLFNPVYDDDPSNDDSDPDPRPPSIEAMGNGCYWVNIIGLCAALLVLIVLTIGWIMGPFRKIASSSRLDKERKFYEHEMYENNDEGYVYTGQTTAKRTKFSSIASLRLQDVKMTR